MGGQNHRGESFTMGAFTHVEPGWYSRGPARALGEARGRLEAVLTMAGGGGGGGADAGAVNGARSKAGPGAGAMAVNLKLRRGISVSCFWHGDSARCGKLDAPEGPM